MADKRLNTMIAVFFIFLLVMGLIGCMFKMPSTKFVGDDNSYNFKKLEEDLLDHVSLLSKSPNGRNYYGGDSLTPVRDYIKRQFKESGFDVNYSDYKSGGETYTNVIADIESSGEEDGVLIVGAHYDSVQGSPGANDNGSGVAALIEVARYFSDRPLKRHHLRLIAFVNEEPPFFQSDHMGSLVYAKSLKEDGEKIIGAISLETIGYYRDDKGSQIYPWPLNLFYPDTGNFISFVSNIRSRSLLSKSISLFRKHSRMPSEGIAAPEIIPGVAWSDHWSFYQMGYKAIMITDTALYRYPHYHLATDTPDKLNYPRYAKVVHGIFNVIEGLLSE